MTRYPHLPRAVLRLLEAGPWEGTPTSLYSDLEAHRVEPWPANPVSLSLWLKHHALEHGIQVDFHHTGERRVLRLARGANGLGGGGVLQHCATISEHNETESTHSGVFWSFPTWGARLEAVGHPLLVVEVDGEVVARLVRPGRADLEAHARFPGMPRLTLERKLAEALDKLARLYPHPRRSVEVCGQWPGNPPRLERVAVAHRPARAPPRPAVSPFTALRP
ncbi:MAG: hypothetical protein KatS3mg071_1227 [Meiothermus sp.]|nr:MAG: hypothetical protein KatS3mg071_1227 [Meiothermus sp.]